MFRRSSRSVVCFCVAVGTGALALGCSKQNPGWVDQASEGEPTSASETEAMSASASGSTSSTSGGASTDTGEESTGSASATTGVDTTGEPLPSCGPLLGEVVQIDLFPDEPSCKSSSPVSLKISDNEGQLLAQLCLLGQCEACLPGLAELPQELGLLLEAVGLKDQSCLTVFHEGIWDLKDPETATGCKTTGLRVYLDNDLVEPIFIASSRVLAPPKGLDPAYVAQVAAVEGFDCACEVDACCVDAPASRYKLRFTKDNEVLTLEAGGAPGLLTLGGKPYGVEALRAHKRGYTRKNEDACAAPIDLVDWRMIRIALP